MVGNTRLTDKGGRGTSIESEDVSKTWGNIITELAAKPLRQTVENRQSREASQG